MAIVASNLYAGRITTDDTGYPLGKAQDIINGEKGTGTPLRASWVNDQWGFLQALLDAANISPSGTPDQVGQSDYLDAVNKLIREPLALKIFQSPTDDGLTEIQTRTVGAGEVYEVRKTSDGEFATIYSDAAGTSEIVQDGTINVSDSAGVVEFYIADGDYRVTVNGVSAGLSVTHLQPFKTVDDMKVANLQKYNEDTRIEWQGYYEQSDGGGNSGLLKFGAHTEDGGSIFSIDSNTYVEANLKGKRVSILKFGAKSGMDSTFSITSCISYVNTSKGKVFIPSGTYKYSPINTLHVVIEGDGLSIDGIPGKSIIETDFNGVCFRFSTVITPGDHFAKSRGLFIDGVNFDNLNYTTTNVNATALYIDSGVNFGADYSITRSNFSRYTNCAIHAIRAYNSKVSECNFIGVAYRDKNSAFPQLNTEAGIRMWGADGTLTEQDHSFSNTCVVEDCKFEYLYVGMDVIGSSKTNRVIGSTFEASLIGVQVVGDSEITGFGVGSGKAGYGANFAKISIDDCWFELVWKAYVGNIINSQTGEFESSETDPVNYPYMSIGAVSGGFGNHYDSNDITPSSAFEGLTFYQPRSVGDSLKINKNRYFYAQDQTSVHYNFSSNEAYIAPSLTLGQGLNLPSGVITVSNPGAESAITVSATGGISKPTATIETNTNTTGNETVGVLIDAKSPTDVSNESIVIRGRVNRVGDIKYRLDVKQAFEDGTGHRVNIRGVRENTGVTDGNINIENLTFTAPSDLRLKDIVSDVDQSSYAEMFKYLDFKKYTYKADDSKHVHTGMIAQDVKNINSDYVGVDENNYLFIKESKMIRDSMIALGYALRKIDELEGMIIKLQEG